MGTIFGAPDFWKFASGDNAALEEFWPQLLRAWDRLEPEAFSVDSICGPKTI